MQSLLKEKDRSEDNAHNRLMMKKMWAKEILEQWYSYYVNYNENHEFFDYQGNPWQPCSIVFDITVNPKELSSLFDSLPNVIKNKNNLWVWIDSIGRKDMTYLSTQNHRASGNGKLPSYRGDVMYNEFNNLSYIVFAEIALKKDKLIIDTNSAEMANLAENFIIMNCSDMVKNPILIQNIKDDPNRTWN